MHESKIISFRVSIQMPSFRVLKVFSFWAVSDKYVCFFLNYMYIYTDIVCDVLLLCGCFDHSQKKFLGPTSFN